jgi:hypothetical protein
LIPRLSANTLPNRRQQRRVELSVACCVLRDCGTSDFLRISFGFRPSGFGIGFRHLILSASPPRMTSPDPFQRQPAPRQRAVDANSFQSVFGATGRKAAAAERAEYEYLRGRNHRAINSHAKNQYVLGRVHRSRQRVTSNRCSASNRRPTLKTKCSSLITLQFLCILSRGATTLLSGSLPGDSGLLQQSRFPQRCQKILLDGSV